MTALDENLVGYLMKALDAQTHKEVETYLQRDAQARRRLELLHSALAPLAADAAPPEPPAGLVERTLARTASLPVDLPRAPDESFRRAGFFSRRGWRRADVLVAAGILVCLITLLLPLRNKFLYQQQIVSCQNNLRLFHDALASYSDLHQGELPSVDVNNPRKNFAGIFVPILHDAALLSPQVSVACPANGRRSPDPRSLESLAALSAEEFQRSIQEMSGCYAYSLGYLDQNGMHHGPRRDPARPNNDLVPIIADRPAIPAGLGQAARGNSPNHRGAQNVLFLGGHVRFYTEVWVGLGNDNIYLNQANRVAAGLNPLDFVLGASADRP